MDNVIKIGGGGKLYSDARAHAEAIERGKRKDEPEPAPSPPPPPLEPPWTVQATGPERPVAVGTPARRDWVTPVSSVTEVFGASLIAVGMGMWHLWLGIVIAGIALLAFGIAMGLPAGRPPQ